ncbi:thiol reductant ABC exporter subunit CydC [Schaalia radingae]|uniref:ATP-binding cassette, subfamily C, CydC n=1 Tax=Schaalia radingae TaxID=131110 RepID=A0ABY0V740_9ACTO|nr:thiol reductant ABC exporter subunit CydC [Schaalia radingae]SDT91657.1 ATP-binding cassette, subfamily C, CydC [Schaalia radingae]
MILFLTQKERRAVRRVIDLLDVDKKNFILSVLLGVLGLGAAIALSATSAWLIARASQHPPVLYLTVAAVAVRLFGISRALMRYLQRLASHQVALTGMDALRQNVYRILSTTRVDTVAKLQRGDLLARTGSDVDEVGNLVVKSLLPSIVTTIVGVGTVIGISLLSPAAGLILLLCLLVSGVIAPALNMYAAREAEMSSRHARTQLSESVVTVMDGASELQIQGRLAHVRERIERIEDSLVATTRQAAWPAGWAAALDRLAMGAAVVGALLVGIPQTRSGALAAVALAVIVLTPLAAFEGTAELPSAAVQLLRSADAATRIVDLLGEGDAPQTHPIAHTGATPRVVAENLAIGWPDGPTIARGISLDITVGSHIAIVGPSGIGKSTLLFTLAGMLPPKEGRVTIDGVDAWQADRDDVTRRITMTAEDAHIFATTVYENIRVARSDVTREEARQLLDTAGLGQWCDALPAGLDTLIGSGGTTVSGGERRRLLLARALAAPAPLVLLDEPAEHLDATTADALMDTLLSPTDQGRGIVVVTHRLSGLAKADQVIVLEQDEDGIAHVVESGTHDQLIAHAGNYRWALQQEEQ